MKRVIAIFIALLTVGAAFAQKRMSAEEYARAYGNMAIEKMRIYGIPASITLAQGMLESGYGGSELAVKANNHFGIKCGSNWRGERVYHDDDAKGECFRKYKSVDDSYRDHSNFLSTNRRYNPLFALEPLDYKGWAHGLKAAGYATNPKYAELLIDLIDRHKLNKYDIPGDMGGIIGKAIFSGEGDAPKPEKKTGRVWGRTNGVKYVVAQKGDTWQSLASQYDMPLHRILRINDLPATIPVKAGDHIYLKNKKAKNRYAQIHTVQANQSSRDVAQMYGVRLRSLERLNPSIKGGEPKAGSTLRVR